MTNPLYDEDYGKPGYKESRKVVLRGVYKKVYYEIVTLGRHPCAYIHLPKEHKLYGVSSDNIHLPAHGGITYHRQEQEVLVLGWDYAHSGDYSAYHGLLPKSTGKQYTVDEILADVKETIDAIPKLRKRVEKIIHYALPGDFI